MYTHCCPSSSRFLPRFWYVCVSYAIDHRHECQTKRKGKGKANEEEEEAEEKKKRDDGRELRQYKKRRKTFLTVDHTESDLQNLYQYSFEHLSQTEPGPIPCWSILIDHELVCSRSSLSRSLLLLLDSVRRHAAVRSHVFHHCSAFIQHISSYF